ncbi:MAG TPA: PorV/PorQ family protein [bacterium]|nr:PorV/PorQ family protein [bacterium]
MKTMDGFIRIGVTAALGIIIGGSAAWAEAAGTGSASFLTIAPGGRAAAMGGAYTAMADDVNAIAYNPGGLALVQQSEVMLMHNEYLEDVNHEYLGFVYPGFHGGTVGADLSYVDLGTFQRYTIGNLNQPVAGGSFDGSDLSLRVGYGRPYNDEVTWGASLKYIREHLDNVKADGWAVDLGVMYCPAEYDNLTLGMTLLNFGPQLKYQHEKEELPLTWRAGGAYRVQEFPISISADVQKSIDDGWGVAVGSEYVFNDALAFRLGYNSLFDAGSGLTCGLGFRYANFKVDYAYQPVDDMGDIHRVSLNVLLGETRRTETIRPVRTHGERTVPTPQPEPSAATPAGGFYEYTGSPAPLYMAPPPIQTLY